MPTIGFRNPMILLELAGYEHRRVNEILDKNLEFCMGDPKNYLGEVSKKPNAGALTTRAQTAILNSCWLILELAVEHHVGDLKTHVQLNCGSKLGEEAYVLRFWGYERPLINNPWEDKASAKPVFAGRHILF